MQVIHQINRRHRPPPHHPQEDFFVRDILLAHLCQCYQWRHLLRRLSKKAMQVKQSIAWYSWRTNTASCSRKKKGQKKGSSSSKNDASYKQEKVWTWCERTGKYVHYHQVTITFTLTSSIHICSSLFAIQALKPKSIPLPHLTGICLTNVLFSHAFNQFQSKMGLFISLLLIMQYLIIVQQALSSLFSICQRLKGLGTEMGSCAWTEGRYRQGY